jgi:hypothetical protein
MLELGNHLGQVGPVEVGVEAAPAALVLDDTLEGGHGHLAPQTINGRSVYFTAWPKPKKYPALLDKLLPGSLGFQLLLKFALLFRKTGIFFLKIYVFLIERIYLIAEKRKVLP